MKNYSLTSLAGSLRVSFFGLSICTDSDFLLLNIRHYAII
jgi:hypothetical protein